MVGENSRTTCISIAMTKNEKAFFRKEAEKEGICLAEFIRRKLYSDYPHDSVFTTTNGLACTSPIEAQGK